MTPSDEEIKRRTELSALLSELREKQLKWVESMMSGVEPMFYAVLLIEAARVMDCETSIMGLSEDQSLHLRYPDYDIMTRGWNPFLAFVLPRLPDMTGIPISESSAESRGRLRFILREFGKISILKKAADMAFHGYLVRDYEQARLSLSMTIGSGDDHFLDQLEDENLEELMNETDTNFGPNEAMSLSKEEVDEIVESLVFPFDTGHGIMVGYGADPRTDQHFYELTARRATRWRAAAGIHPDVDTATIDGTSLGTVLFLLISFYMKHIWFVGIGRKTIPNVNHAMSLTIWKDPGELLTSITDFTGMPIDRVKEALKAIVVTKDDAHFFEKEGTPFVPMLLEVSKGYWLAPISSAFRNPFDAARMLGEFRNPAIGPAIRAPRENWMIEELAALFMGSRYRVVTSPTRLKRSNVTLTDIDAAILDMTTGELAIFQLKWQDFGSNMLSKIRSRASNFVEQVDDWAESTQAWIDEFGIASLLKSLRIRPPAGVDVKVFTFAIGKSNARFSSYGFDLKQAHVAASNWAQFTRLRYEVGPAEKVLSELHRRIVEEKGRSVQRSPLPYEMTVGETAIVFNDMWSTSD